MARGAPVRSAATKGCRGGKKGTRTAPSATKTRRVKEQAHLALQEATAAREGLHAPGWQNRRPHRDHGHVQGRQWRHKAEAASPSWRSGDFSRKTRQHVRPCFAAEADGWDLTALKAEARTTASGSGSVALKPAAVTAANNNCPFFSTGASGGNAMFSRTGAGGTWGGVWEVASDSNNIKLEQQAQGGGKPSSAAEEKQLAQLISRADTLKGKVSNATDEQIKVP
ncbi:hypothetical protein ERJ75_001833800 [Trypanosoma vivax]|nr:hypothetical protein ERJ75_001833800 [Trypanosoma vivax]